MAATKRAELDAAVKQMKTDASEAEARLQKMKQAGADSWSALSAALAESRKSFDRANQASWEAFKRLHLRTLELVSTGSVTQMGRLGTGYHMVADVVGNRRPI